MLGMCVGTNVSFGDTTPAVFELTFPLMYLKCYSRRIQADGIMPRGLFIKLHKNIFMSYYKKKLIGKITRFNFLVHLSGDLSNH